MIGKYKVGLIGLGTDKGIFKLNSILRWNGLDELAIYKGLERKPHESNIHFYNRIKNIGICNSSIQGMNNSLNDAFDREQKKAEDKTVFLSSYKPISPTEYLKIVNPICEYSAPKVTSDGVEYQFLIEPDSVKDISSSDFEGVDEEGLDIKMGYDFSKIYVYKKSTLDIYWTLWKNMDQSYTSIFQCSEAPKVDVILEYLTLDENNELKLIEERVNRLSRDENGDVIYE